MPLGHDARQNHLLQDLPAADRAVIVPALELVPMRRGDLIYEPGMPLRHAYFPTTSVVSLHYVTEAGESAETAGVGHEGVVGVSLFMGGQSTTGSAVVQIGGHAYRISREALTRALAATRELKPALLRYAQALITQVAQTAACYRHHNVEQQLSRWLLTAADRVPGAELVMTQELVACLLGVRRESITAASATLQRAGHILCRRGHMQVTNTEGLQAHACECYAVVKTELQRLRSMHVERPPGFGAAAEPA
jgi:CRP-like cAMP-binding protein